MQFQQRRQEQQHQPTQPLEQIEVALISMPFGVLSCPSLALGLLKGSLEPLKITSKVFYFTLKFAELIGSKQYRQIAQGYPNNIDMLGEWIFAGVLDEANSDVEGYLEDVLYKYLTPQDKVWIDRDGIQQFIEKVLEMRTWVDAFLDVCVDEVLHHKPSLVGFTSVFQQQVASLALAKRIKQRAPQTFIVFGGANCEGVMGMEVVQLFPFVDAVVSGEGDQVFPLLVQRVLAKKTLADLPNVYTRRNLPFLTSGVMGARAEKASFIRNMDSLPYPDFDDYFQQYKQVVLDEELELDLPFETSRGCWWGEKHHCTFCGLNGATMAYRSKSAQRALDELLYLTKRYPGCAISAVDNILDMKYFKDFIPTLAELKSDLKLFYEVKANLRKDQVRMLRAAGVMKIQPGIESLSNQVLTLMRKGVKALQNIQLLKWCREMGVSVSWNILCGFPGEDEAEYEKMLEIMPWLTHLQSPGSVGQIRLDRFSPNFDEAEQIGLTNVKPYPAYFYIYPFPPENVANLAYYFTFDYKDGRDISTYVTPLLSMARTWRQDLVQSKLFAVDHGDSLLIWDMRPVSKELLTVLTGLQRELYIFCDAIRTVRQLQDFIAEYATEEDTDASIETLLDPLIEQKLMLRDENSYLSLAILRALQTQETVLLGAEKKDVPRTLIAP